MNDTLQLIIVLIIVALAAVGLVRNFIVKTRTKSCHGCPVEGSCKQKIAKKSSDTCKCQK